LKQLERIYEARLVKRRFYRTWWQTKSLSTAYLGFNSYWFYRNAVLQIWEDGRIRWVEWLLKRIRSWKRMDTSYLMSVKPQKK
jgi:hypothetical protein